MVFLKRYLFASINILFCIVLLSNIVCGFGISKPKSLQLNRDFNINSKQLTLSSRQYPSTKAMASEIVSSEKKSAFFSAETFDRLQTSSFFFLWYLISAYYNIYNKRALNYVFLPWIIATIQMGTGLLIFFPLWFLKIRTAPFSSVSEFISIASQLRNVAIYTTLSHIAGVIALGTGAVSFTQVVKAAEPVFTALISAVFTRQFLPWQSYASLLPVIAGVSIASVSELSFSYSCLLAGILSNVFAAARGVFGKQQMGGDKEAAAKIKDISPENYYSIVTTISFLLLVPVSLIFEGRQLVYALTHLSDVKAAAAFKNGMSDAFLSGVLFYLYNELSFRVLNKVSPVTHALANTFKRIVIILSSVLIFHNPLTFNGKVGSSMAILGVFIYSLSQSFFAKK